MLTFLLVLGSHLFAQSQYGSEEELIKAANELFENNDFKKAMPLYSQLVSLYPKDLAYNYKYGACLLFEDRDKAACLKFLKYGSSKSDADPASHYYFGLGLHMNYDFSKAIKQYEKFKSSAGKKELAQFNVDRQIEMCENGKTLLKNVFDLNVIDKQEISESEFFRIYDLGEIGGKIIVKPDEFKSKLDLKANDVSLIHLPPDATMVYFSGYGDSKDKGKEIFRVRKKEGAWGSPENIGTVVNTEYDEDFPFMHPDGTLYFASKGHNSMGGYDLFKSSYNESTDTWSKPENLNFAISSAFDDVLFISDYKNQLAYFASRRSTVEGKLNVYRVQISRKPFDQAFLSGNFITETGAQVTSAKISIYNLDDNQKVGTFYTDEETGRYNVNLPKSGKTYKFVVETDDDSPVHTGKVEIPLQDEMVSLKQEIRLVGTGDDQKLVIKNLFDQKAPVSEEALASVLRSSSDLEVNVTEEEVMQELASAPVEASPVASAAELNLQQKHQNLLKDMEILVADLNKGLSKLNNQIAFGFKYSFEKAVIADQMYDQVEVSRQDMINEGDKAAKEQKLTELKKQRSKLDPIASDAIVSFDFTKSLANEYDEKLNDAEKLKGDLTRIKSEQSGNAEDMQSDLDQYSPLVEDMKSMRSVFEIAPQRYQDLLARANEKLIKEEGFYKDAKRDIEAIRQRITELEKEIASAKSKKAKDQLTAEKGTKEIDLQDLQYEFEGINKNYKSLKTEVRNLEADSKQINAFIAKIKGNTAPVNQLNADDQAELNKLIDFLKEQRLIEDVIGDEMESFIAQGDQKKDMTEPHSYPPTDNNGNPYEYNEQYQVNLAAIELIIDEKERLTKSAILYDNWSRTVKEDREIQENHLMYTKDKTEKQVIEERIKILKQKEQDYTAKATELNEKALAVGGVEVFVADTEENASKEDKKKSDDVKKGKGGTAAASAENTGEVKSVTVMLATPVVLDSKAASSIEGINSGYEKRKSDLVNEEDVAIASVSLAALEIQWAKSIDELIAQKEAELQDPKNKADWPKLQKEIREYKAEQQKHLALAAAEFSDVMIAQQMDDAMNESEAKYYIPFDPSKLDAEDYNMAYQKLVDAIEQHQIMSEDEKNRELSLIHDYWSRTIQDEILWQEVEKTKLKSQAELQAIENKVLDLTSDKKKHITLSNEYYAKYKQSQRYQEEVAETKQLAASGSKEAAEAIEPNTFGSYAAVYENYQAEQNAKKLSLEKDLELVGSKSEKQQIGLSIALLDYQAKDEEIAVQELKSKGSVSTISEEADKDISQDIENWQEDAEDYVFTKKDFSLNAPDNAQAYASYKEAKQSYNEVLYLEKQKSGLMNSSVVNKNAEAELIELQQSIDAKKIQAYKALAEANKAEYNSNKKEIDRLLKENPDLEKTNPKMYRDIKSSEVVYAEVEKYLANAEGFKSNALKFDIYDQAQFMSEFVLTEQKAIIKGLKGQTYTGELAFLAAGSDNALLEKQTSEFKITKTEMDALMLKPAYIEYEKDRKALQEVRKERMALEAEVINQEKALSTKIEERNAIVETAAGLKKGKKKKLMKEATVMDQEIAQQQKKLDSTALLMVQLKERENNINQNSARVLKTASVEDRYKIVLLAELRAKGVDETQYLSDVSSEPLAEVQKEKGNEELNQNENQNENEDENEDEEGGFGQAPASTVAVLGVDEFKTLGTDIPQKLDGDFFIRSSTSTVSPYSANKPIPVDVKIPEGLIFKVQIGAYRNAIPQDLFKGFAPLMGEKLDNGITRYTAGLFRDFKNANQAKNEIRRMGYDDAFVVAFMNGVRISFQELQNIDDIDMTFPAPVADNTFNGVPPEVLTTPSVIDDEGEISSAIAEQTTNAKEVKGLFFTVQVGVYTNTLLPEKLKIFRELNSELLPNGNIRYSVGQFQTLALAQARRDDVQKQIGDAFITAYLDGNRITVGEAIRRLNENAQ